MDPSRGCVPAVGSNAAYVSCGRSGNSDVVDDEPNMGGKDKIVPTIRQYGYHSKQQMLSRHAWCLDENL